MQAVLGNPAGDYEALTYSARERDMFTGMKKIVLEEWEGSGRYGELAIDFDELTVGAEYTNESYQEGALMGAGLISDMGAAGGASFLRRERFVATAGQTVFTPTKFSLTEEAQVWLNNAFVDESLYTIEGNTLSFTAELNLDDVVIIFN
jgi:hypothetical protein